MKHRTPATTAAPHLQPADSLLGGLCHHLVLQVEGRGMVSLLLRLCLCLGHAQEVIWKCAQHHLGKR